MSDNTKLLFHKKSPAGLIEVWQNNSKRCLTINSVEQSSINTEQPGQLASPLYNAFLSSLLFIESPNKVLLAGLGGGALACYMHYIMPEMQGEAVELDEAIATLARQYFNFPEKHWDIFIDDIRQWRGSDYDLVFLDIADKELTPSWLITEKFLLHMKAQLSAQGILVINLLVEDAQSLRSSLTVIRKVFKRKTLCLSIQGHKNIVVLAFNCQPVYRSESELAARIETVSEVWPLNFNVQLARLLKDNPEGSGVF